GTGLGFRDFDSATAPLTSALGVTAGTGFAFTSTGSLLGSSADSGCGFTSGNVSAFGSAAFSGEGAAADGAVSGLAAAPAGGSVLVLSGSGGEAGCERSTG